MATDWKALRLEYVNGSMTYAELAAKHGIKEGTVRQRANRDVPTWAEARNALSRSVTETAQAQITEKVIDELTKFNEDDLKVAKALRSQVAQHVKQAQEAKKPIAVGELRSLASAMETAQRIGRLALGATTENTGISGGATIEQFKGTLEEFKDAAKEVLGHI